jgi:hypothetical protein
MLLGCLLAGGCSEGTLGPDPQVATLMLLFPGNDTVFFDIASGAVSSGPIGIFANADFSAQFLLPGGTPDPRVTEALFRLDVTPVNTGIVTFTRDTPFSGALNKVSPGNTEIVFALVRIANAVNEFAATIPIEVY